MHDCIHDRTAGVQVASNGIWNCGLPHDNDDEHKTTIPLEPRVSEFSTLRHGPPEIQHLHEITDSVIGCVAPVP